MDPRRDDATTEALLDALRHALSGRSEVRLVLLFGSCARGTASEGSDVDLAVLADPLDAAALSADLTLALHREVEAVDLADDLGVPLLEAIIQDGVVVHEGAPGEAARWRARALIDLETDRPWFARMRDAWLRAVAEHGLGGR